MIPSSARVWIAMGHTDMRKGMQGLALLVQQALKRDPHGVICTCSAVAPPTDRHSAYVLRLATIAYPWHPLAGRTVQVSPFRRDKDLKCIYTEERPDLSREQPTWMFDAASGLARRCPRPHRQLSRQSS